MDVNLCSFSDFFHHPVICGAVGALSIKVLDLIELPAIRSANRPDYSKLATWLPFLLTPLLGAFVVFLYVASDVNLKPIVAANVGVSAPIILRSWAQASARNETIDPGGGA